jgi:hypothetical protein
VCPRTHNTHTHTRTHKHTYTHPHTYTHVPTHPQTHKHIINTQIDPPKYICVCVRMSNIPVCDLPTAISADDLFLEEEFSWITTPRKKAKTTALGNTCVRTDWITNPDEQVFVCYCQTAPTRLPRHFTPCCLPHTAVLASREIQMLPGFKSNLLGLHREPLKTQTLRDWSPRRAAEHHQSFMHKKWVRVWVGQGHAATIGWLQIITWDYISVSEITKNDCVREGRPGLTPAQFSLKFFPKKKPADRLIRLQFHFVGCYRYTHPKSTCYLPLNK